MAAVVVCNVLVGLGIWLVKRLVRERASVRRLRTDRRTFADTSRSIFKETHGRRQPQNQEQHYSHPASNAADEEERCSGSNIHPSSACTTSSVAKQQQQQSTRSRHYHNHYYCRSTEIVVAQPVPEYDPLLSKKDTRKRASL
ncbi:Lon protease [Trichinella spiralis]